MSLIHNLAFHNDHRVTIDNPLKISSFCDPSL
jgi:hypothetical protein